MLLANQRLPDGNQILVGIMSLSPKSILGKRKFLSTCRWRFLKKKLNFFFYLYLTATTNKEFTSSLTSFCSESSEKKLGWSIIFHKLKSAVKAKITQTDWQVSEGGTTVKPGRDSIHELIIWKVNPFVASVTCSRYQIAFKWSANFWQQFLVNDEMENISMYEISI